MARLKKILSSNIIALAVFILSIGCAAVNAQSKKRIFQADSTINGQLKLEDHSSVKKIGIDTKKLRAVEGLRESPVICFLNRSKNEYLLSYQYEGDPKNAFACFEIGYTVTLKVPKQSITLDIEHFNTETGIGLGISKSKLIELKGLPTKTNKDETMNYSLNTNSSFVKRYQMPGYFLHCQIKNAKLSSIKFGFDYP